VTKTISSKATVMSITSPMRQRPSGVVESTRVTEGAVVSLAVEVVACVAGLPATSLTSALTVRVPSFKEERSRSEREKLPSLLTVADVLKMSPPPSEEMEMATV